MFERFADSARQVVVLAQDEVRTADADHIGTEHLLLALAGEPSGPAGRALRGLGLDVAQMRDDARRKPGPGELDPDALALLGIDLDEVRRRVEAAGGTSRSPRRPRRRSSSRSATRCRAATSSSAPSTSCSAFSRSTTTPR
jgi:ATP-dependent Clp protease ATP-binding subunit ClpA